MRVRLDVGQATEVDVEAESWWADPGGHDGTDLAVVTIAEDATAGRECEPARFGRIRDCAANLMVEVSVRDSKLGAALRHLPPATPR